MALEVFKLNKLADDDRVAKMNIINIICGCYTRTGESCKWFIRFSKHLGFFEKLLKSYGLIS